MSKRASPTVIGGFVLGALALLVAGIVVFGSGQFFRETFHFVLYIDGSVNGLKVGAPVKFKGVQVGSVDSIMLTLTDAGQFDEDYRVPIIIKLDADRIREHGASGEVDRNIGDLIEAGLRAQLAVESFVTGVLYIALDMLPDQPAVFVKEPGVTYQEIPSIPTPMQEIQRKVTSVMAKLDDADIPGIVAALRSTIDGVDELVNSPRVESALVNFDEALASIRRLSDDLNSDLDPLGSSIRRTSDQAGEALVQAQRALARLSALLDPTSPFVYQLGQTLADVSEAARAVRELADTLERNPSALVRGKDLGEEQ